MDDILTLLSSPAFWFSSIFIALLINLAAMLLQKRFDAFFISRSKKKRESLAKYKERVFERVEQIKSDYKLQLLYQNNVVFHKARQTLYLQVVYLLLFISLLASINFAFVSAIVMAVCAIIIFLAEVRPLSKHLLFLTTVLNYLSDDDDIYYTA